MCSTIEAIEVFGPQVAHSKVKVISKVDAKTIYYAFLIYFNKQLFLKNCSFFVFIR